MFRVDEELLGKLELVCNHLNISRAEGIRRALKQWINDQMWEIAPLKKLKEIFLEEE